MSNITEEDANRLITAMSEKHATSPDRVAVAARAFFEKADANYHDFLATVIPILYQVGLVGVKLAPHMGVQWSYLDEPLIRAHQLSDSTDLHVHKTFWSTFNVTTKHRR
jgi:hypothetical protein